MSSTTELEFSFSDSTVFSVLLGTGELSNELGIGANEEDSHTGIDAMEVMNSPRVLTKLTHSHRAIVNMLMATEEIKEKELEALYEQGDRPEPYRGVTFTIYHRR